MINVTSALYAEWRKQLEDLIAEGNKASTDCGEVAVREDFTVYAELPQVITFEEMLLLEKAYEEN